SAIAGDDYTNTPITVTFANGQTSKTVTIPITDDSIYELTETVNLTISNPTGGATLGTQQTATLSIIDNDAVPGVIQFSNATYSVNENGTPVTAVTLTRSNGSDGAVSVRINLTNGTATAPSDYNNTPITANFANGETSKTIEYASISQGLSFDGINDRVESNQLFANTTDTFTIEFWAKPTATRNLTTESNSGTAGTSGQRYAIYPVQGEAASLGTNHAGVGVSVGTNGISIFEHSSFYLPSPLVYQNTISDWTHIAIVYNNKTPSLYVNGQFIKTGIKSNYIVHPSLQLGVNTGGSSNYGAYQGQLDDVRIWNKSRTQAEIQANFNRELTGNESGLVGYWNFNTVNNNTVQDLSSNQNDGTVFGAQSSTGFVPITNNPTIFIVNDTQFEPNETVTLTLSNPTGGATLGTQTTAVLTIINDDLPQRGIINLNSINYTVNENGTANITLTRTNGSDGEVSVILTPSNGSAIAGDDYTNTPITVTFANGQTSKTVTIPIT
ncbi:MAG: Calx-beta domain-containing protein, partial [Microcystis sp.]